MHLYACVLPETAYTLSSVECFMSMALILEIELLTNMILHAQRKEKFTLGERLRDGHVACAT